MRKSRTLIQSVSGMAHEQGLWAGADRPQHLPAQVVDHGTGYLAAFGVLVALARRAREGGSYLVRVSLAQTARWVDALGRVDGRRTPELTLARLFNLREGFGRADDRLPPRFSDPLPKHAGLTRAQQEKIVTDYYVEQGWDPQTGVPTADTIRALALEEDAAAAV